MEYKRGNLQVAPTGRGKKWSSFYGLGMWIKDQRWPLYDVSKDYKFKEQGEREDGGPI